MVDGFIMDNPPIETLMMAFEAGIDYGLLMAEEERDSEDMFDAYLCWGYARKMCIPSAPVKRRMPHSDKWRQSKRDSYLRFLKHIAEADNNVLPKTGLIMTF